MSTEEENEQVTNEATEDPSSQVLRETALAVADDSPDNVDASPSAPTSAPSFLSQRVPIKGRAPLTRKQMIEYLTLRTWLWEACVSMPFTLLLWVSFIYLIHTHAQVYSSFQVSQSVIEHMENIVADPMAGLVPEDGNIMAAEPGKKGPTCKCACHLGGPGFDVCSNPSFSQSQVASGTMVFDGEVTLEQMAGIRSAAMNLTAKRQTIQQKQLRLDEIRTIDDIWFWLQRGFIPTVYAEQRKKGPFDITSVFPVEGLTYNAMGEASGVSGTLLDENRIIAGVRLRQIRMEEIDCETRDELRTFYGQKCHSGRPAKEAYGPGASAFVEGFVPNAAKGSYDFYFDMERPMDVATEKIQFLLRQHEWLGEATGHLEVQAAFLSTKAQLYGLLQVIFEFEFGGRINTEVRVRTVAATIYPTIFHAIPDVIWALLILSILQKEIREVYKHYKSGRGVRTFRTFLLMQESELYIATSKVELETLEAGGEPHLNLWAHMVSFVSQLDHLDLKIHQFLQHHVHDWMEMMDIDPFSLTKQLRQCRYKECKQVGFIKLEIQTSQEFSGTLESFVEALMLTGNAEEITPHPRTLQDYVNDFWNALDWVSIFLGIGIGGFWVYTMYSTQHLNSSVGALPAAPSYNAAQAEETKYHAYWTAILDDTEQLFFDKMAHRIALFWYTMILMLRFFKAFQGQPRLAEMNRTLVGAFNDIIHFIIVFFLLFLSFAVGGYVLFGAMLHEWSTLWRSVNSALQATMGTIDFDAMYEIAPISASMWYWLFMVSIVFVMFNMFLAIMYDHYSITRAQTGDTMGIGTQLKESLRNGLWYVRWRYEQFRDKEPVGPSLRSILEELLNLGQASEDVIKSTETSVLGPRMLRHKQESERFANMVLEKQEADPDDPLFATTVKEDLKEMKIDKEMAEGLIMDCRAYFERQALPQETRVAQMRDLVKQAEDDFAQIASRLEQCQLSVNQTLRHMSSHVNALELTSHSTLAELARTAQDVGVPEAKSNKGPSKNVEQRVISHLYEQHAPGKKRFGQTKKDTALQRVGKLVSTGLKMGIIARSSSNTKSPQHDYSYEDAPPDAPPVD